MGYMLCSMCYDVRLVGWKVAYPQFHLTNHRIKLASDCHYYVNPT